MHTSERGWWHKPETPCTQRASLGPLELHSGNLFQKTLNQSHHHSQRTPLTEAGNDMHSDLRVQLPPIAKCLDFPRVSLLWHLTLNDITDSSKGCNSFPILAVELDLWVVPSQHQAWNVAFSQSKAYYIPFP